MRRRIRWARVGKWAGVVTLVVIGAMWLQSGWWDVHRIWRSAGGFSMVAVRSGYVVALRQAPADMETQWGMDRLPYGSQWRWRAFKFFGFLGGGTSVYAYFVFPLWVPWTMVLIPTLWLWCVDRRRPPGACPKCRYDLTGNTSGICPECGSADVGF